MDVNLWLVCFNAFAAVLGLLSLMAVLMRGLTWLFPEQTTETDAAVFSAIAQAASSVVPGARVTRIEETTGKHP